ncbi:DUF2612 domain-containing protein [Hafnia alvei]|uniref:DUF2612 domain-containing protein n=1 Tax=Hafnia alvei TaxID=569 RepID=UPI00141200FE|nr:DUF2612 domain-containing protein [Hafnia alvei]QIP56819.1 DUF2612 domain-containing protein [Hafnia alvei]
MTNRYSELIPSNQRSAPKYHLTIETITDAFSQCLDVANSLITIFDLDKAIGKQLDIIGEWAGRSRRIKAPIDDYFFTLDSPVLGFDYGYWKNRYDSEFGYLDLDDVSYRTILRAKIGANNWDGTCESLPDILDSIYPNGDFNISFIDNGDMTMTVTVKGKKIDNITKEIIKQGYLSIKPLGVTVNYDIIEG